MDRYLADMVGDRAGYCDEEDDVVPYEWINWRWSMQVVQKVKDGLKKEPKYRYRSSVSGHFVSAWYAIRHPRTTTRELIERG